MSLSRGLSAHLCSHVPFLPEACPLCPVTHLPLSLPLSWDAPVTGLTARRAGHPACHRPRFALVIVTVKSAAIGKVNDTFSLQLILPGLSSDVASPGGPFPTSPGRLPSPAAGRGRGWGKILCVAAERPPGLGWAGLSRGLCEVEKCRLLSTEDGTEQGQPGRSERGDA